MHKTKILLVDDDPNHIQLVQYLLKGAYELTVTRTGEEALAQFRHQIPDLVLLDINMPGMSGIEVCKAIKEEDYNDDVVIIFLSGNDDVEERTKGYEAGADDYITKPFQIGEFRKKIDATARFQQSKKTLEAQEEQARIAALESKKQASQYSQALQFVKDSFHQKDIDSLIQRVFQTLNQFDLDACLQVRINHSITSVRAFNHPCSPIETELFSKLKDQGSLVKVRDHIAFNQQHASILIKQFASGNEQRDERLIDVLTLIAEGFEAQLMDLTRKNAILELLNSLDIAMNKVTAQFSEQATRNINVMDELLLTMNETMNMMGLTNEQEEYFFKLIEGA